VWWSYGLSLGDPSYPEFICMLLVGEDCLVTGEGLKKRLGSVDVTVSEVGRHSLGILSWERCTLLTNEKFSAGSTSLKFIIPRHHIKLATSWSSCDYH